MKKGIVRAIALALCAAMLISTGAVGASAVGKRGRSPVIILPGINHSPAYLCDENNEPVLDSKGKPIGGTLLIPDVDALKKVVPKLVFSALATIILQYPVGLQKTAYEAAYKAFSIQRCDDNGDCVNNLITREWKNPISQMNEEDKNWLYRMIPLQAIEKELGGDLIYFFTFNLVGDPMDSAAKLNDYVQEVRRQTGKDKVSFLPISLGGTILTAYLDVYGHEYVDEIINVVSCLDGTDIVADLMARKFNLTDEFLYHEYIPAIIAEEEGRGTLGYLINSLLHILPRKGLNALLTGAMSGVLDALVINCPQMWAMLPSNRYDSIAAKYLNDPAKARLRARTDRFQTARLNLKRNVLAAYNDGVKVSFISGSGLDFGERTYTFFSIVDSAGKVNSDGIINLSSTTLGASGAPRRTKPPADAESTDYISPDGTVDVSTAVLPDHTWIFLGQHHEVGNNDVVLNLAKAIIMGEVYSVRDDPEKYPQFNYSCNTKSIRRWKLPDARAADQSKLSPEDAAELNAAIADGQAVLDATIADEAKVEAAEERLVNILVKIGANEPPKKESKLAPYAEKAAENYSLFLLKTLGGGSLADRIFGPAFGIFKR